MNDALSFLSGAYVESKNKIFRRDMSLFRGLLIQTT